MQKILTKTLLTLSICLVLSLVPLNTGQAAHPGPETQFSRNTISSNGIACTDCHDGMSEDADPVHTSWVILSTCGNCHTQVIAKSTSTHFDNTNQMHTLASETLLQNNKEYVGVGIYCPACHGLPHAIYAALTASEEEQSIQSQSHAGVSVDCEICHME